MLAKTVRVARPQLTLALLKPDLCADAARVKAVYRAIDDASLTRLHTRDVLWRPSGAEAFYAEHRGRFFYERLGPFQALVLGGDDAIKRWRALIGPTHPIRARVNAPESLRSCYGLTDTRNSFHGSDSPDTARREIAFFFPELDVDACLTDWTASHTSTSAA
ncbi:nucleoside diphosphate kinase [Thamnocephalis sphaerospora]|uniref:Nucleoside diphosphate kinase n=1 Tax=Thamnocephalis sphaerospora TaxID=78915 RepID=A0A4P9XWX9_9FUNG|nr:nucleoside diphosphate kinase [Thamnocephalis sphaerospora]|eukprot:RKP10502.1 nucleoside diphosphate kinase [Thamnocephalis sphaerospora]